jgi:hypothetical protein
VSAGEIAACTLPVPREKITAARYAAAAVDRPKATAIAYERKHSRVSCWSGSIGHDGKQSAERDVVREPRDEG